MGIPLTSPVFADFLRPFTPLSAHYLIPSAKCKLMGRPVNVQETNGIPSLPTGPTQVTLRGNVGSLDAPIAPQLFTFGPRGQGIALRGS